jgi:hypothetical protein
MKKIICGIFILLFVLAGCRMPMPKSSPTRISPYEAWKYWRLDNILAYISNKPDNVVLGRIVHKGMGITYYTHPEVYNGISHPDLHLICVRMDFIDAGDKTPLITVVSCDLLVKEGGGWWNFMKPLTFTAKDMKTNKIIFEWKS